MPVFSVMSLSAIKSLRALAHETRWRIAERLLEHSLSAAALAEILQLPRTSVSDHLQIMREAGLLNCERHKRTMRYNAAEPLVALVSGLRSDLGLSVAADPVLAADAWNAHLGGDSGV